MITPRTLKGFRDLLPATAIRRERLIAAAIAVYQRYGYVPIETPALEYAEILTGGGGTETDKQMYRFDDAGGRHVGLRFDLTVPLARYIAQHIDTLGTPFRGYHVATVWRGENTQRGRYREFVQGDFDIIGTESPLADIETVLVVHDVLVAMGVDRFTIRVNDRRILNALLARVGLERRAVDVLRILDKLDRVGAERVGNDLAETVGASRAQIDEVLELTMRVGPGAEVLDGFADVAGGDAAAVAAIEMLGQLMETATAVGISPNRIVLDGSIARGLDYYTGIVFEAYLDDHPQVGACCSGGRYDDLASRYTSRRLPAVGGSLGVDRLLAAVDDGADATRSAAPVLITRFGDDDGVDLLALAATLRRAGIGVEVYPDPDRIGAQLRYADRHGHRVALIIGPDERGAGEVKVKTMATGDERTVPAADVVAAVGGMLDL
ncbi:MAG: histidine--tRNA ligase [Acidimicrobiia bacterium]|nr:histidine--tRNA ligase [Acidimicrobiia bacterium]